MKLSLLFNSYQMYKITVDESNYRERQNSKGYLTGKAIAIYQTTKIAALLFCLLRIQHTSCTNEAQSDSRDFTQLITQNRVILIFRGNIPFFIYI